VILFDQLARHLDGFGWTVAVVAADEIYLATVNTTLVVDHGEVRGFCFPDGAVAGGRATVGHDVADLDLVIVSDPVGAGFVAGLPHPGGNITGFTNTEPATAGKWLSLLKEIAPGIKRAALLFNPDTVPVDLGKQFLASFETAAGSLRIEPVAMPVHSDAEIETGIAALGAEQAGLVEYSPFPGAHWEQLFPRRLSITCQRSTRLPDLSGEAV
jgi:hypothetical protein